MRRKHPPAAIIAPLRPVERELKLRGAVEDVADANDGLANADYAVRNTLRTLLLSLNAVC